MDQVQGWLSSGSNGKEKTEEEQGHKEDKIVKGLVEKLNQKDGQENVKPGGGIQPYLDDGLDLPRLEDRVLNLIRTMMTYQIVMVTVRLIT